MTVARARNRSVTAKMVKPNSVHVVMRVVSVRLRTGTPHASFWIRVAAEALRLAADTLV